MCCKRLSKNVLKTPTQKRFANAFPKRTLMRQLAGFVGDLNILLIVK